MEVAVLSDIHGNYVALTRCIEYALEKNITTFIFLGDYVGELAYPEKTMKIIYEMSSKYKCYFIKGNKEDYWINYKNSGECGWEYNNSTTGSLLYTYQRLSKKDIEFFKTLGISQKISIEAMPPITICHGSPYRANEKLVPNNDKTTEIINTIDTPLILCGHTHIQSEIENNGKQILNPGSVGVPLYSYGKAQFMILNGNNKQWKKQFISVKYDVDKVINELHTSTLDRYAPYWCMVTENLLKNGDISHGTILAHAMALCNAETGNCKWPNVPEKYWKEAVAEIIGK